MDLATVTLTEDEIRDHARRYTGRGRLATQVQTALDALDQGRQLVDLRHVVNNACADGFPAVGLAPVPKTGKTVYCRHRGYWVTYTMSEPGTPLGQMRWSMRFKVEHAAESVRRHTRMATIPGLPGHITNQASRRDLILWEAEWDRVVTFDPALLEPVGGHLYLVKAVWDLSPLEQALLT